MRASRVGWRCELRGARISTTRGTRPGEAGHDNGVESIRPSYVPGVKESSVCLRNRPESSQGWSALALPDRAPGTVSFQRERLEYPGTQGRSDKMGPSGRGTPSFRTFLLSLANQTRTSQRSCIVVREHQSSPGDRIGTSMRTSDGPSRHQVSGKILHPRSDRDRRACPELQGFLLQHVRDCEAGA